MSLLDSLLEGSSYLQPSSLLFCSSPKEQITPKNIFDPKTTPKQQQKQSRPPSKSLTKMSLYNSNPQINPKERLLHRLAYKLEIKCRKHYYNFFVKLENMYKKSPPASYKKIEEKEKIKIIVFIQKLNQIQSLLFSKYFQRQIKKSSFMAIRKYGGVRKGIKILCSKMEQVKKDYSWMLIYNYSKKIEKEKMRMEILTASAQHIINSYQIYQRLQSLTLAWSLLCENGNKKQVENNQKNPQKEQIEPINKVQIQECQRKPLKSELNEIYQAMKNRANSRNKSPCKMAQKINLNFGKTARVSLVQQPNFLKAYCIQTKLTQRPFENTFSTQPNIQITKKCEPDPLRSRQLNDLYDKNILFFPFTITEEKKLITESSVQEFNLPDHTCSQATFIHPLKEVFEDNRMSLISKTGKLNTFGLDAVSFKNSLVCQRQSYKMQGFLGKNEDKREASFLKAKNFIKECKKVQDDSAQRYEPKIKVQSRYESAEKTCFPSKIAVNNITSFDDTLPLSLDFKNSQYSVAEPDYGRDPQTNRTSQTDYLSTQDKDRNRRSSYIKVTKKL